MREMGKAFTSKIAGWCTRATGKRTNVMEKGTRHLKMGTLTEVSF
jgi:hypothetical protein